MSESPLSPQFHALTTLMPDCVFMTDPAGRITYVSEACEALFLEPARELVGRPVDSFLHASDRELARHALDRLNLRESGPLQLDLRMLRRDGRVFFGRVKARSTADGLLGTVRDVTADDEEARRLQVFRNYQDRGLALLYLFTVDMASLKPGADIHRFIARGLREFTAARFVTMSEYDPAIHALRHRCYEIDSGFAKRVFSLMGARLEDILTPVTEEKVRQIMQRGWIRSESLYDMAFGTIPLPVAAAVQKFVGVDRFFALSFVFGDQLYGTSLIGLLPGEPDPPLEILQAFRHTVALALRSHQLEKNAGR